MIHLYWAGGHRHTNFGDSLSPHIVEMMTGRKVVYARPATCDMAAIGSILHKIHRKKLKRLLRGRFSPIHIWGTGAIRARKYTNRLFHIHALRGELTRDALQQPHSLPLGDPGLLISRFGIRAPKRFRWGIAPHINYRACPTIAELHRATPNSTLIDLAAPDIRATIAAVQSCDFIAASSLHGLVAADALGIPSLWVGPSEDPQWSWKFRDYFSAIGRTESELHTSFLNADLRMMENQTSCAEPERIEARCSALEQALHAINF